MTYEELLMQSDSEGLCVREKAIHGNDGRITGNRIAIRKDLKTTNEKTCVLAEELGHYYTNAGNVLDMNDVSNRKQEYKARLYAYNCCIGLLGLVKAYERGCRNAHEIAEYLDVTEQFLHDALSCYKKKYGLYAELDNYLIYFEPLAVVRIV